MNHSARKWATPWRDRGHHLAFGLRAIDLRANRRPLPPRGVVASSAKGEERTINSQHRGVAKRRTFKGHLTTKQIFARELFRTFVCSCAEGSRRRDHARVAAFDFGFQIRMT